MRSHRGQDCPSCLTMRPGKESHEEKAMPRKKISRNASCPCGSGKKYKKCCYGKDFDFERDDQGNVFKSVPMSEEMADIFEEQRRKFIEKYGREPGPTDQIFF